MYRRVIRPWLFKMDVEVAHERTLKMLAAGGNILSLRREFERLYAPTDPRLKTTISGVTFPGPVGLAAGLDKNAEAIDMLSVVGFGSLELGSVTAHAQAGNEKPRLFRLPNERALINRMGFNNAGTKTVVENIAAARKRAEKNGFHLIPLGVNIGKSRIVDVEDALGDYETSLRLAIPVADYLVLNVSSPNTPGLRTLQDIGPLTELLTMATSLQTGEQHVPVFLKIAPDLTDGQLEDIARVAHDTNVSAIIATNTTITRPVPDSETAQQTGGLSGAPLRALSLSVIQKLRERTDLPIIGVGGIASTADVFGALAAGASAVQIYTGFIYNGPFFPHHLHRAIVRELDHHGLNNIEELREAMVKRLA